MSEQEKEPQGRPKFVLDINPERDYQYLLVFAAKQAAGGITPKISPEYSDEGLVRLLILAEKHIKGRILPRLGEEFEVVQKMITPKKDGEYSWHTWPSSFEMAFRPNSINTEDSLKFGFMGVVAESLGAIEINLCNERVKAKQRRKILKALLDMVGEETQIPVDRNILRLADRIAFSSSRMLCALAVDCLIPKQNTFPPSVSLL